MHDFWAMSDVDKTLLVLKILVVAFGWASVIIAAIAVMALCLLVGKDYLEKREEPQVVTFQLKQTRRDIRADQDDEFFDTVQELQNELR